MTRSTTRGFGRFGRPAGLRADGTRLREVLARGLLIRHSDFMYRMNARAGRRGSGPADFVVTLVLAVTLVLLSAPTAVANEEETDEASLLVMQTISLIANGRDVEVVEERLVDALEAPDQDGVDMAKVEEAAVLLEQEPVDQARLEQIREVLSEAVEIRAATGYGAIPEPGEMSEATSIVTGAETGTVVVLDELRPARGVDSGSDVVLVLVGLAIAALGLLLARRWRPHHSIHQLHDLSARSEVRP